MSSKESDALRIPIEIKTEDMAELQQLLQQITEAENDLSRLKSTGITKGAQNQTFAGQARGAGGMTSTTEGRGGIFESRMMEGNAMPMNLRDRSGKQAFTRENQFKALQDQVNNMQEEQGEQVASMFDQAFGLAGGYAPFAVASRMSGPFQRKVMPKIKQKMAAAGMGMAAASTGTGASAVAAAGGVRMAGYIQKAMMMAQGARAGPIGAIIAASAIIAKTTIDWMHGPGGFWDLRFKRNIQKEIDPFIERREKQMTNIGLRTVRVTSIAAARGTNQVHSTQDMVKRGIPIYNGEFEAFAKGLFI
jgi:hypothetical protein